MTASDVDEGQRQQQRQLLPEEADESPRLVEPRKVAHTRLGRTQSVCFCFLLIGLCAVAFVPLWPSQLVLSKSLRLLNALTYGSAPPQMHLVTAQSKLCLDWSTVIVTAVQCNAKSAAQVWMYGLEEHRIRSVGGRCLDAGGEYVHIWECMYPVPQSQQWVYNKRTKTLHNFVNTDAFCLTTNGNAVWLELCSIATKPTNESDVPLAQQFDLRETSKPATFAAVAAADAALNGPTTSPPTITTPVLAEAQTEAAAATAAAAAVEQRTPEPGSKDKVTATLSKVEVTATSTLPAALVRIIGVDRSSPRSERPTSPLVPADSGLLSATPELATSASTSQAAILGPQSATSNLKSQSSLPKAPTPGVTPLVTRSGSKDASKRGDVVFPAHASPSSTATAVPVIAFTEQSSLRQHSSARDLEE